MMIARKLEDLEVSDYDIVIVGAGISGLTLAERYGSLGKRVLIVEKRDHIGGNCHDFIDQYGILVASYGPHYFHTNDQGVWDYVQRFSAWTPYEHRVLAHVEGLKVPIPVNRTTINLLFDANLKTDEDTEKWFLDNREQIEDPKNAEDAVIARMGQPLYELLFKGYTTKQWGMDPRELAPEVTNRIPIRFNTDDRYFTDRYQAMPQDGYTKLFENMVTSGHIDILLNYDWEDVKGKVTFQEKLFFTGRIDQYFQEKFGKLQYRSISLDFTTHDQEYFQDAAQENYPSANIPYTRIVEYKRATGQVHSKTTISHEYSTWEGEPYYPVLSDRNQSIYQLYQAAAVTLEEQNIFFVGRLANYKYFNMDQAFRNALDLFGRLEGENKV